MIDKNDKITLELSNSKRKLEEALKDLEQKNKCPDRKTKRIKEHTVLAARGLRPEIQRLLTRHTAEIADLEAEKERRLSYQERELNQQHLEHHEIFLNILRYKNIYSLFKSTNDIY